MRRRGLIGGSVSVTLASSAARAQVSAPPEALDALLRPIRDTHGLPALAAAVVRGGHVIAAGAVGTRRADADIPVTLQDRFHIGSDTKAMTATLAAMEVEAGRLGWESPVGASFPEFAPTMDAGLRGVTLAQLLSHTSGLPRDNADFVALLLRSLGPDPGADLNLDELRRWMIGEWSRRPLDAPPGTRFAYANMNYVIAGAMIERSAGATWEELIVARLFVPLGLASAGLGPQARRGHMDAPLPHARRADGSLKPMLGGPNADVPAVIGPAGVAHLSILDFAAWAAWNAAEGRRGPALLRPETVRLLQTARIATQTRPDAAPGTPNRGGYGLGWGVIEQPYAREPIVTHTGSNTMNLAIAMLQPRQDFGLVLATNCAGAPANAALNAAAAALYARFGPAPR